MSSSPLYIGLMSGTSLDGVDGVLTSFDAEPVAAHLPFPDELRSELLSLQAPSDNEIHREALAANRIATLYAECVHQLLDKAGRKPATIMHQLAKGYSDDQIQAIAAYFAAQKK